MANEDKNDFNAMLRDSKDMPKFQTITDQEPNTPVLLTFIKRGSLIRPSLLMVIKKKSVLRSSD